MAIGVRVARIDAIIGGESDREREPLQPSWFNWTSSGVGKEFLNQKLHA